MTYIEPFRKRGNDISGSLEFLLPARVSNEQYAFEILLGVKTHHPNQELGTVNTRN
jgi:hypothetical protein